MQLDDYTKTSLMLLRIALILYIHPPYLNPNFELRSSNGNLQYFKIVRIVSSVPASTVSKDRQFIADYINQSSIFALYKNEH